MEKHFKMPLDTIARWLTATVPVFFIIILPALLFIVAPPKADSPRIMAITFAAATVLSMPIAWLFAPKEYLVTESGITVRRRIGDIAIPADSIKELFTVSKLHRVIRTAGVGGVFGYYGWFRCKELGSFKAYTGRTRDLVIIKTLAGRTYALSPDDNDAFLQAVKEIAQNVAS